MTQPLPTRAAERGALKASHSDSARPTAIDRIEDAVQRAERYLDHYRGLIQEGVTLDEVEDGRMRFAQAVSDAGDAVLDLPDVSQTLLFATAAHLQRIVRKERWE